MKILVVSQYFWPENFRINDLCMELAKRGHEVTVLTGKPNYPDGNVFKSYLSNPNDFNDYNGCHVVRVPMIARGRARAVKLILNYVTFAFSASIMGAWKLRRKQFDVIFVFEPSPITVGLPAVFFKKIKKAPVVFWVLDLWPETLEAVGVVRSKRVLGLVGKLVSFIYNRCDLILGQSKAFYSGISPYCNHKLKIKYFPNWSEDLFLSLDSLPAVELSSFSGFKVLFAGNVGDAQDFPAVLSALAMLKEKNVNVKLFIVGDGRALNWLKLAVEEQKLTSYVALLGRYPLESMPSFYAAADALLVTLKESPVFTKTIPGKVQSYLAAEKPILTMLSGEGSRVVEKAAAGYCAESGDSMALADNILRMSMLSHDKLRELGRNAKHYSDLEFNRNKLISQLESWFVELAGNREVGEKKDIKK